MEASGDGSKATLRPRGTATWRAADPCPGTGFAVPSGGLDEIGRILRAAIPKYQQRPQVEVGVDDHPGGPEQ